MISKEEVLKLAELARLKLADTEVEGLQKDISNILDYVGQVSSASADAGKDTQPVVRNVLREDTPRPSEDPLAGKEDALKTAFPVREGNFNVVRKIIQKDE
jgi:aspartyl-tRNA(Asn)/glutamyl-tRNA(Gln) amidotransferase subunit C